ncbi:MAG TPA: hypothetical protein GX503_04490 [Clostridiales bacterium]|nr:hypothetical protein [Clostridiales bacterium]
MVTIEEKLGVFTKMVLGKAQQEFNDKLQEIEKQNQETIEAYRQDLKKREEKIINEFDKKGLLERNKRISKAKLNGKKQVLAKQQELVERHIKNLRQMAIAFTESESYESFLKKLLAEIFSYFKNEDAVGLFLTERDIERYSALILAQGKEFGFKKDQISIQAGDPGMIGGVQGIDQKKSFRIDLSMYTMIEQYRKQIGQKLYTVLKEAGGIDE